MYIHHKDFGFLKIGTGLDDTVRGHVYKSSPSITQTDAQCNIGLVNNRVLFYSPELQTHPKQVNGRKLIIAAFDPATLGRTPDVNLFTPNGAEEFQVVFDSQYLYLISKKKEREPALSIDGNDDAPPIELLQQMQDIMTEDLLSESGAKVEEDNSQDPSEESASDDDADNDDGGEDPGEDQPLPSDQLYAKYFC